jgi:DNA-binding response OmpR family regulator
VDHLKKGSPSSVTPAQTVPALVVLAGEAATEHELVERAIACGAVVVIATCVEQAREWLPAVMGSERDASRQRHHIAQLGHLRVDMTEHQAYWKGRVLKLTKYEFQILAALMEDPGRTWTYEELLGSVWGISYFGDAAPLRMAVKRLRKKLACDQVQIAIESVRGVGFRIENERHTTQAVEVEARPWSSLENEAT